MVSPGRTGRRNRRSTMPVWLKTSAPKYRRSISMANVRDILPDATVPEVPRVSRARLFVGELGGAGLA